MHDEYCDAPCEICGLGCVYVSIHGDTQPHLCHLHTKASEAEIAAARPSRCRALLAELVKRREALDRSIEVAEADLKLAERR